MRRSLLNGRPAAIEGGDGEKTSQIFTEPLDEAVGK
jgi:hypothetical protein